MGATVVYGDRRLVFVQQAVVASVQAAVSAKSIVVQPPTIDAMLGDLPSAHRALPIGRRIAGQGCHGTRTVSGANGMGQSAPAARSPHIRFVYFPVVDESDRHTAYHQQLVTAEVLLDRVLAARSAGLRPIGPALDYAAEARATVRPPREIFHVATLEYRRWYDDEGAVRAEPLTQEALAKRLMAVDGLSTKEARHRAAYRCHALPAADQAWLIDRRNTPLEQRPLNQVEFQTLVDAIEGAYQLPATASHVESANRQIALRVAAMLGSLLDEFVASPFKVDALGNAFNEVHLAHLRQGIVASRQMESASGVLWVGPRAWFAAKAVRMRAEHQIGLAKSPTGFPVMRLTVRPVVAVVGGRLRTFLDGWSRGRGRTRAVDVMPKSVMPKSFSLG
jgi:hypothetical protein